MIIDFSDTELNELCGGIYINAQVAVDEITEGAGYDWNTFTSTYVDGDIYIQTPDGSFTADGKFGEYLRELLIQKANNQL